MEKCPFLPLKSHLFLLEKRETTEICLAWSVSIVPPTMFSRCEERHHRGGDGGGDWKFCLDRINDNQMLSDFTSLNV